MTLGTDPPKPGIWYCPNCHCRIQIVVDPDKDWQQSFVCVCGITMEAEDVHEATFAVDKVCAHCHVLIIDESTVVSEDDRRFCCPNCATADKELKAGA